MATEAASPGLRGGPFAPGADRTLETISPLLDKAQSYALGIDTSAGLTADLVAVARSDDDVKPIADTLQAVLTLAANAARANPREFYGLHTEAMDWITQTRDSLLNGSSIRTEGRFAHLQAKSSVDIAGIVKVAAGRGRSESRLAPKAKCDQPQAHWAGVLQLPYGARPLSGAGTLWWRDRKGAV